MKRVCVFCGSKAGRDGLHRRAADEVGRLLAGRGLGLVYGGGSVGLMGVLADAALASGGEVIGVIPDALATAEVAHERLTELHVVSSMHARKALMASLSDAFLALPGGFGTLDELFEIITWAQLRIHGKPIALLNVGGYFDPLITFLDQAVAEGFISAANRGLFTVAADAAAAVERLASP